jgi:hypothetical protein
MSRKYIAREVLKRLRLGEPLGEELIRKFIRFLPELYKDSNGYDDFAKLRHDVFSAFRHDHADRLIGFDLGVCWGAISEEESVSLDYAQAITSLRIDNSKLRQLLIGAYKDMDAWQMVIANSDQWGYGKGCLERLCELREAMRKLGIEVCE